MYPHSTALLYDDFETEDRGRPTVGGVSVAGFLPGRGLGGIV